jgi:hypothetical protein
VGSRSVFGRFFAAALLLTYLGGCANPVEPVLECTEAGGITPICGLVNPEDLALLSPSPWIAVSQIRNAERGGNLIALHPPWNKPTLLFPVEGASLGVTKPSDGWGAKDCPGPPDPERFSPLGLDLARRADGKRVLFAINHGSRQSVELFEVGRSDPPTLTWQGCVLVPGSALTNDLAALPDGGFVVTNMYPRSWGLGSLLLRLRLLLAWNTGYVLEWTPANGWRQIPHSKASYPNGVEVSPDGETLYFAAFGSSELVRMKRSDGSERTSVPVPRPDNLTWGDDKRLLVAAHTAPITEVAGCLSIEEGSCGVSFSVYAVDPETLETERILEHPGGPPMGGASVALQVGDQLFLGSFVGDRIGRASLSP